MVFGITAIDWLMPIAAVGVIATLLLRNRIKQQPIGWAVSGVSWTALFACVILLCATALTNASLPTYHQQKQTLTMTVTEQRGFYDRSGYYTVTTDDLNGRSIRMQLQVQGHTRYEIGDVLQGEIILSTPQSHQKSRLQSDRIVLTAKTDPDRPLAVTGHKKDLRYYASQANHLLRAQMEAVLPNEVSAMVIGICLGDVSRMPQSLVLAFNECGMSHMTAVSGLHTTTLATLLLALFLLLKWNRRLAGGLSLILVWGFVFMVGLPYSAIRAGIMFTILVTATIAMRESDPLNNLGGAVLCILLGNPFAVGDIGFMASVSACLGIILLSDRCAAICRSFLPKSWRQNKIVVFLTDGISITIGAFAAGIPCSLLSFYRVSLVSPLANVLGVPLAGGVLVCSLLGSLIMLVPGLDLLGSLLLNVGGWLAEVLMQIAHWFSRVPFASVSFASGWCLLAAILVLIGGVLCYRFRERLTPFVKRGAVLLLACVLVFSSFLPVYGSDSYEIMVLGNDFDTSVVVLGRGQTVVIGCSSAYQLEKILQSRHVSKIDALILPTRQTYEEVPKELCAIFPVERIYTSSTNIEQGMMLFADGIPLLTETTASTSHITVNVDETFTCFTISLAGRRFAYEDSAGLSGEFDGTIRHPVLNEHTTVTCGKTSYLVENCLVLQVNPQGIRVYCPRFVY